jgi:phosphoglucomutase
MVEILSNLRKNPLEIQGFTLESVTDYLLSEHYESGKTTEVLLPKSNVLVYRYSGHYIIFRPSGTEPKLKIYISVNTKAKNTSLHQLELIQKRLKEYFGGLM